jgi:2-polyprenyl-3-methyl-5-hydroxy-6-metoxy-1,4-benzoquinol methylase
VTFGLVPARSYEPELLDGDGYTYDELAATLRDIERVNRWLGGAASLRRPIEAFVRSRGLRAFSLLDVGTGGGEVPRAVVAAARRRGVDARAAGLDLDPHVVRYATARGTGSLSLLRADGFRLPFADGAFDFVTSSMMFHHFRESEAAQLLGEMARVARRAVVVNDLARHRVPWAAIGLLARLGGSRMVRHDGPLSVLRGWRPGELLALAEAAGLSARARVRRWFPYRLVLVVEREGAPDSRMPGP